MRLHVFTGHFLMEDFSISGLNEGDRPFFTAKRLSIALDWSTLLTQPSTITVRSVELTDWEMLVEKWSSQHSFPKFTRDRQEPPPERGPSRVKMKYLRAWRGQFAFEDHQMPWSVVAPNIDLNITDFPTYHGEAMFHGGTVAIQKYLPMWVNMKTRFRLDGSLVHLTQLAFDTDGSQNSGGGVVDFSRFPEMRYDVKSRVNFQRMREIFFTEGELGALRRWGLHRVVSSLQGRARPDRHVHAARSPGSTTTAFRSCTDRFAGRRRRSRSPRPDRSCLAETRALRIRSSLWERRAARPRDSMRRTRTSISPR